MIPTSVTGAIGFSSLLLALTAGSVAAQQAQAPATTVTNRIGIEFILVQPATFRMGAPDNERRRDGE